MPDVERSIRYRIRESRLPQPYKLLSDFDFSFQPKAQEKVESWIWPRWTLCAKQSSILFLGNCGVGKSHLAQSLSLIACEKGYKVFLYLLRRDAQ